MYNVVWSCAEIFTEIITISSVSNQLMMTSAQVIETSATTTDNGPYQDFAHRTITLQDDMLTPGFKLLLTEIMME